MGLVFVFGVVEANAQVATNGGSGLAATYTSLANAITALNAATITAPVTITLTGNETAPAGGYSITQLGGTVTNTITITGSGSTITAYTPQVAGQKYDAIFKIVGGDWITIQSFTMQENVLNTVSTLASNTMTEFGVALFAATTTDGAQNNTIQNNTITLSSATKYQNAIGIFSTCASSSTNGVLVAASIAGTNSNNKFYSNTISGVAHGIYFITPVQTATVFESGNDIGGSSAATGNTITFGATNTAGDIGFTSYSGTTPAGIYFRNPVGSSAKYNTITSVSTLTLPCAGIICANGGTAPSGITYTTTFSNNSITITNVGVTAISGIDFGSGLSTGTIVCNNNNITINNSQALANAAAITGIKANYASATNTANGNAVTINQTFSPATALTNSSAVIGIYMSAASTTITANTNNIIINQTNSPTAAITSTMSSSPSCLLVSGTATTTNCLGNTLLVNRVTSMAVAATAVMSGQVNGVQATATTALTFGSSGNGNTITVKETASGTGTSTFSSAVVYLFLGTETTASVAYNNFNTTGGTIRSTGTCYGVYHISTISTSLTINQNTFNIDRVAAAGAIYATYESATPSTVSHSITNNSISFTNIAGTTISDGIYTLGGTGTNPKNISSNTINISGTNSGQSIGIIAGYGTGNINSNNITINNSSTDIDAIWANQTGAAAFTISLNTLSLTSNTLSPTNMIGISGGATGPFQIFSNTFNALNFTGIITGAPTVSGITVSAGTGSNIYSNVINNISSGAATSTASPVIRAIGILGGISTNVYKNKIYGITTAATGATTLVSGITISAGTTNTVYNNLIGGLNASAATNTDAIRGINITSTTTLSTNNIYFNTIYLSGSGGANFGSSGIFHTASATATTAALDMRNNIIVNNCTASGTGFVVAFRRSAAATLGNFATTSNRNALIAGSLMYDGTNNYTTLAAYQTAVSTREANSFTTEAFTYGTAGSFFQSLTGSDATYLQLVAGITSQCESGASVISSPAITDDYKGTTRSVTTPDVGADEFVGISPAPLVTLTSVSPSGNQCSATARVVTVDVTTPAGTITGVTISYNNGAAAGPLAMTNTSGTTWTYTIPAASPTNTIVTWSVTATNSASLTFTYTGASYQDDPTFGVTATAASTNAEVCTGAQTTLSMTLSQNANVSLGAGASTSSSTGAGFFSGTYGGLKTQYIVRALELTNLGLVAGNITSLSFEATTAFNGYEGFALNIGHTAATVAALPLITSGLSQVYTGTGTNGAYATIVGVNTLTFSTPFNWDGTSNIVLSFCWSKNPIAASTTSTTLKVDAPGFTCTAYGQKDNTLPAAFCPLSAAADFTTSSTGTSRPKFIFNGNKALVPSAYSWSDGSSVVGTTNPLTVTVNATSTYTCTATITNGCPITASVPVTAWVLPTVPTASNSSQCGTAIPTASVADPNGFTTPTFKWYDATSGGTLLQSSTSTTYTSNVAATTTFYVSVINPTTNCESARSPVTVTVSTAPALTITASQAVCNNEIVELNITSTIADYDVYTWTPSTYLFTDAAATVAYTGTGNPSIVYFKSATGAANVITLNSSNTSSGCTNLTTSTVSVLPSSITASAAVSSFCLSGSTSVSVASIPAGATVQWQSSPDNATWTDIASATLATVATGTITSTTYYRLAVNKAGGVNCLYSNVVTVTVKQTMSGTYTVGAGGNYTSLTSAVADLACVGVSGAVVLSLTDAAYNSGETFPIVIPAVAGASATNTVTVRPANGVTSTISGTVASAALIKLNGADYVTIDGSNNGSSSRNLTITNTNTTSPTGISISSLGAGAGATYNTIKNCNISTGVSAAAGYGIAIGGSTPGTDGADNDNVTIQNNAITIATIGIYADGLASVSATGMDNLLISGNTITTNTTIQTQGIQVGYGLNGSITGNTISVTTSGAYQPVGISIETGFVSSSVTNNIITQALATNTGGYGGRGITVGTGTASSNITVANNIIYGVNGSNFSAFSNSSSMGIGIGMVGGSTTITSTAGGINLYYNSVYLSGSYSYNASCLTAALYVGAGASVLDIENNIFMNALNNSHAGGTASKAYAIYSAITNTAYTKINYNDYVVSGSQGVLGFLSSDKTTIAAWRTATAKDANSVNVTPNFTSATDLHLISSTNCGLDGMGTPISGITTDYDLDTRNATTPDIGADEFTSSFSASAGTAQSVCGTSVTMAASLSNGTGTWTPTAGLTYTPNTTTATAGVSGLTASNAGTANLFTWTITGAGSCNSALPVTITAYNPRTVNAGVDQTVCSSSPNVTLAGTKGGSASSSTVTWTTSGTGTFDNANSLTAVYTVSAADISAGSVTLTLTTDNTPGPCIAVSDQMVITINPRATANANSDQSVCAGSPDVTLAGSIGGSATTATWTGGTGTFNPDNTSLTAVYTPSAAEITAGTVTLTLTTDDPAGVCAAATDQMVITIRPSATANAGTDQSVCVSSPSVTLNGSIGGSALSGTWSGGIGTFTPDNTTLNAVYTPAAGENAAGMVITLTLTTTGPCAVTTDDMLISIHGNPDAPTGSATQTFCAAGTIADLSATGTSIQWYAAATGGSAISSGTALVDGTTYYASQTVGICESVTRLAVTVTLNPAATANAGTPQSICAGSTVTLDGSIGGGASTATWSGGAGTFSPDATTVNAVYTPTAGEISAGTVTLTITSNDPAGPCGAVSSNMTVTITSASGALAGTGNCKNMNVGTGAVYNDASCDLINRVVPNGASPVAGLINSCVTIDGTVQFHNADPYLQRHFDLEPVTNAATATARITLYALQSEFDAYNLAAVGYPALPTGASDGTGIANLMVTQYHGTGTAPGNYTGSAVLIDPADVDIQWDGTYWEISFNVTGFSGFFIHTKLGSGPLPISINYLNGTKQNGTHLLNWKVTCNSTPTVTMILERSADSRSFSAIHTLTADAARCNSPFDHTDAQPLKGMNYYRLKMVDANGKISYSGMVALLNATKGFEVISIAPNPVTAGNFTLHVTSAQASDMLVIITDMQGRVMSRQHIPVIGGFNSIPMNVDKLAAGTYTIQGNIGDDRSRVIRFVKQ